MIPLLLHAGCGPNYKEDIRSFHDWNEIRLDLCEDAAPDIQASFVSLPFKQESFDAILLMHSIEHVPLRDGHKALCEFFRVLKPQGFLIITCPDLEAVAKFILAHGMAHSVYDAPVGPIYPLDILYGHQEMTQCAPGMEHKCGYTFWSLKASLENAGFKGVFGGRAEGVSELDFIAFKESQTEQTYTQHLQDHFPWVFTLVNSQQKAA